MTGGEILVECLKAQGVRDIAGMPGNQNIWIYDAILQRGGINHRLIRNEQGATLIANGYAPEAITIDIEPGRVVTHEFVLGARGQA